MVNKKVNLFVGLKKSDMKTDITQKAALAVVSRELIAIGVVGFNATTINGYWNAKAEKAVLVSFINTFEVTREQLTQAVTAIKARLEQESILVEVVPTAFEFM